MGTAVRAPFTSTQAPTPWRQRTCEAAPYAIAYVALAEGVTMMTNIVGCDFDRIAVGMPVKVAFRNSPDGVAVPVFEPA